MLLLGEIQLAMRKQSEGEKTLNLALSKDPKNETLKQYVQQKLANAPCMFPLFFIIIIYCLFFFAAHVDYFTNSIPRSISKKFDDFNFYFKIDKKKYFDDY